jgi:hypothetical protein
MHDADENEKTGKNFFLKLILQFHMRSQEKKANRQDVGRKLILLPE